MDQKSSFQIYNSLSRKVEDFIPIEAGIVKIYACGPTVYDFTHIGHIRKYLMDDVLVKLFRYLAFTVTHVMNITDVGHLVSDADTGEDKLEKGAKREGKTAWEVAKFYEEYFFKTLAAVGISKPDIVCRATEHIPEQISLIKILEEKGFTYKIADGIYFDSTKFPDYGKLAGINPEKQLAGARIEPVPGKKHATDFALWKFSYPNGRSFDIASDDVSKKRHMEWNSPWGVGFPGWHIECSAMSMKYLGDQFDIHTGGIDHIPIHHTNEIAQSEAASGKKPFVKYWIHHNFVTVNGQKMSKSLNNYYTLDDVLEKGYDPIAVRYLFLQTSYRQEANFTWEALSAARSALRQLRNHVSVIKSQIEKPERVYLSEEKLAKANNYRKHLKDVLKNDLNTPQAIAVLWEIVKSSLPAGDKYDLVMIGDEILGLGLKDVTSIIENNHNIPSTVMELVKKRESLRREGNFAEADVIRKQIEEQGFDVEDIPEGSKVRPRNEL